MFPWSKFKSATPTDKHALPKIGKPGFLIIKKWSRAQADASLIFCSDFFFSLTVYFSLLCTWQAVFSPHPQTEYTRQLWNRWLFLPAILWPLKSRLVTGRTVVWIQKQIGKWIKNCLASLQKCCPGAHDRKKIAYKLHCWSRSMAAHGSETVQLFVLLFRAIHRPIIMSSCCFL